MGESLNLQLEPEPSRVRPSCREAGEESGAFGREVMRLLRGENGETVWAEME